MSTIIIAIAGRKQSGKDTLCRFLTERLENIPSKIYSFADPLKRFCIDVMGLREEQCYGSDAEKNTKTKYLWDNISAEIRAKYGKEEVVSAMIHKEFGGMEQVSAVKRIQRTGPMTGREVMQVFGSDLMREMFSENIWVNATINTIKKEGYLISFISDMRFPSEVNSVLNNGGYIIRLTRKMFQDIHISETALDDFDWDNVSKTGHVFTVDNQDKTIEEKNIVAVKIFNKILEENKEALQ